MATATQASPLELVLESGKRCPVCNARQWQEGPPVELPTRLPPLDPNGSPKMWPANQAYDTVVCAPCGHTLMFQTR
jgi:hypothetical protein